MRVAGVAERRRVPPSARPRWSGDCRAMPRSGPPRHRAGAGWMQESIRGIEKKPMPHLLCTTNMILHEIEVPSNIRHDNALVRPLRDYGPKDRVDVIVTNPPFGGMEEDGVENSFPQTFRTRETADLFLVLLMTLLKPAAGLPWSCPMARSLARA